MASLTLIPRATIHPGQINMYYESNWYPLKPGSKLINPETGEVESKARFIINSARTAAGKVSDQAKRKMTKAIDYMLLVTNHKKMSNHYSGKTYQFKVAFVTLTLPSRQIHSDNQIKSELLNQFLIEIRKRYRVKNYIWRAEKQKNGSLHFHILVDKFIPYQELRDRWNRITNKLGYVDRYREEQQKWHEKGFRVREELLKTWSKEKQYQAWLRGSQQHWNSPNSTDIHSIRKVYNLKLYVMKYMMKASTATRESTESEKGDDVQQGRIWGCNQELSNLKGAQLIVDRELQDEIERVAAEKGTKIFKDTYYSCLYFDIEVLEKVNAQRLLRSFAQYLFDQFSYEWQPGLANFA